MDDNNGLNANDIIGKIRSKKEENIPLFGKNFLEDIHKKMVNKITGTEPNPSAQKKSSIFDNKANAVIEADMRLRSDVKDLIESLIELNDKDIAKKLLTEHIAILKETLAGFKSQDKK